MVNVNAVDGIKYGFRLMGYLLAVFVIGFVFMAIGADMVSGDSPALGGLLAVFGFLVVYAGIMGMGYKVIADGVEKGVRAANQPAAPEPEPRRQQDAPRQR